MIRRLRSTVMTQPATTMGAWTATALALAVLVATTSGCEDEAFCANCGNLTSTAAATGGGSVDGGTGGSGGEECIFDCPDGGGAGGGSTCEPTNGGVEICDSVDNDCDGDVDEDFDFTSPETCGTCDHNCFSILLNANLSAVTCTPAGDGEPGTCTLEGCGGGAGGGGGGGAEDCCAPDFYDWTADPGCESYCVKTADDDTDCNNRDDDCDQDIDEDVDLCSADNCGSCGRSCVVAHGTAACEKIDPSGACTPTNTQCVIASCDDDDSNGLDDWHDADGKYNTGCEYSCEYTDGPSSSGVGVEQCGDSIDNDCDYLIDGADNLSGDTAIGATCYGDPDGICATAAHAGTNQCVGNAVVCTGANVLHEGDEQETCDNEDDDCDGVVDNDPVEQGNSCQEITGNTGVLPCRFGTYDCQAGGNLVCLNEVGPATEYCNGADEDCDGTPDNNLVDIGGACDVPPVPSGSCTSACTAGTLGCNNGSLQCENATGPAPGAQDTCAEDADCDGACEWPGDLDTDPYNCGACDNDCYDLNNADPQKVEYACVDDGASGRECERVGCRPGWIECNGTDGVDCETQCSPTGSELCNDYDDDCNCLVDDVATADKPTSVQVCGVSVGATGAECTTNVAIDCVSGVWTCTFPSGVCPGGCSEDDEICDVPPATPLDNDCDGQINERTPNWHDECFTPVTDGECRGTGKFECINETTTQCDAVRADCAPNCEEFCDGKDNDCDGSIDEPFSDPGADPNFFVKPAVVQISDSPNLWMYTYEASRPNADATSAGSGNGYHCAGGSDCAAWVPPGRTYAVPDPPAAVTIDATPACSEPGRIPWFNASPTEVEHTCYAMGGFPCDMTAWQDACKAQNSCIYGYSPRPGACVLGWDDTANRDCNIWLHDFDGTAGGIQHGLYSTGNTTDLLNCWADLSTLWTNPATPGQPDNSLFDLTGNLREITFFDEGASTSADNQYALLGGSFLSPESGSTCTFEFYKVGIDYKLFDTGFRCCFDTDPTQ